MYDVHYMTLRYPRVLSRHDKQCKPLLYSFASMDNIPNALSASEVYHIYNLNAVR